MMKVAFIFSGQGSQYIGMGKELYNNIPSCQKVYDKANEVLGFDLKELIFNGDKEELNITENTQPAILTTSIAILQAIKEKGIKADIVAGLSLGEYSALVASEALDFETAVSLVKKRGRFMQEAVPQGIGSMAAVIGLDESKIKKVLKVASEKGIVEIANYNTNNQIVIGGECAAVELATELLKESGARMVIPLKVSGPFHTSLLNEASIKLENEFNNIEFNDPKIKTITNVTADFINDKTEIKNLLINQVKSSVRWSETIEKMIDEGIDTFIEIGPLKTLSSFVREISKEKKTYVKIFNVEDLKSLNKTLEGMEAIC
ncbi:MULTISPECIES: ACP S-malonyltransferase [unclassified Clostridium]|uniref:ACP S-malonyltransferase n=1 Tax=Clostridium TaxID=1485 RepID=UPI001C8CAF6E|nr:MULTISPECIES: ACP S-malonyltransferase [unclassified Clostridium]MBX9136203.1 ACP S-malonyltransferase [Clostridium sp. K12(2020)]MBX9143165.1 ACP S-malonyltransferase [Clostridium sp. K13]MDU2289461.1 ACP S-malonyltransferase [Clostridium celatum]MDU4326293.1 ACP S-malonyltransferase [Clostridium celatum]